MKEDLEMTPLTEEMNILKNLLNSLQTHDIKRFEDILNKESYVDINYFFEDPDHCTLLDISCSKPGCHLFADLLLKNGANPNIVNPRRKKAPLHFAVLNDNLYATKNLLEYENINVNILDSTGSTPLHYAIKLPNTAILDLILKNPNVDVNITNNKGKCPLLVGLEDKNKYCIQSILKHENLDIENDRKVDKIKELLADIIPDWTHVSKPPERTTEIKFEDTFKLLRDGSYDKIISILKAKKDDVMFLEGNNGSHTFLEYCCEFGLLNIVQELFLLNINPNMTSNPIKRTPVMTAAYKGYVDIVQMFVNNDKCSYNSVNKETVLHCVVKGTGVVSSLGELEAEKDHLKCLSLLLTVARNLHTINNGDIKGNTALHYAAKQGDNHMVLLLLNKGASIGCFNMLNEPACADIHYKTLKKYLDCCIYTNDKLPREDTYEMVLNYSCLKPVQDKSSVFENQVVRNLHFEEVHQNYFNDTFESKPLLYMAQNNELKYLLKHPIFTSFLHLKWHKIHKGFYFNLLFYFFFWALFTLYILTVYNEIERSDKSLYIKNSLLWLLLTGFLVLFVLRELIQLIISPLKYLLSPENWLEIGIISVCVIILCFGESTPFTYKKQLSAIGIMLSWTELVLLIGRHPALSTNIQMLKTVSWNFLKFLAWYSILIIAFALSFYILFGINNCSSSTQNKEQLCSSNNTETDDDFFRNPGLSVFKTVIMLTGEFDASSIPFVEQPGISHFLFIAFVFLIAIVLFNLLNGLAVSDTQAIKSDAELVGYISRVKLIAYVETLVSNPLPHKSVLFNYEMPFCWENNFFSYFKNKIVSKYINLFQNDSLTDGCEIRILPNLGNKVQMDQLKSTSNRKDNDFNSNCYNNCSNVEMESSIVHAIKDILLEKNVEKEHEAIEKNTAENERKMHDMIKECMVYIQQLKATVNENKVALTNITELIESKS